MRRFLGVLIFLTSCYHDLQHEKYIDNNSLDTVTVTNPDEDTVYTLNPGARALIYSFEILDTKQESDPCKWLGPALDIRNQDDSLCLRSPGIEDNWTFEMSGSEKERVQQCFFSIKDADF